MKKFLIPHFTLQIDRIMGRIFKTAKTELQYSGMTANPKFMIIDTLPEQTGELTYNGEEQFPTWQNLDPLQVLIEGELSAVNAGEHFITVTPTGNFVWKDRTQTPKQIPYTIKRKKLAAIPAQNGTLTFNNTQQTPSWKNYNSNELAIGGTYQNQLNAGTYTATFTPTDNYCWSDGTFGAKNVTWSIAALKLAKPSASTVSYGYTGNAINLNVANYNSTYMTQSGTASATNKGNYTATYTLKSTTNTTWSDNSVAAVNIAWSITVATIPKVTANTTNLIFDADLTDGQEPSWINFDSTKITKTGSVNYYVGTYHTTFSLKDKTNTQWQGGDTADIQINWQIDPRKLTVPSAETSSFTYNGQAQEPNWLNYDEKYIVKEGAEKEIDVDDYKTTFSLRYPESTTWSGGSTTSYTRQWYIRSLKVTKPTQDLNNVPTYVSNDMSPFFRYPDMGNFDHDVVWNNYDTEKMTIELDSYNPDVIADTTDFTLAYTVSLKNPANHKNYIWDGSSSTDAGDRTIRVKINKRRVPLPTFKWSTLSDYDSFDYNTTAAPNHKAVKTSETSMTFEALSFGSWLTFNANNFDYPNGLTANHYNITEKTITGNGKTRVPITLDSQVRPYFIIEGATGSSITFYFDVTAKAVELPAVYQDGDITYSKNESDLFNKIESHIHFPRELEDLGIDYQSNTYFDYSQTGPSGWNTVGRHTLYWYHKNINAKFVSPGQGTSNVKDTFCYVTFTIT